VFDHHVAESIAVLEAIDKPMPIGMASAIGRTGAAWRCGAGGLGRWVIVGGRFVPVDDAAG